MIAASAVALVTITVVTTVAAPAATANSVPTSPLQYDHDDPSKSFLVELNVGSTSATLIDVSVGGQRSDSHVGDPPLLRLSLTHEDRGAAGAYHAWDPRWHFDQKTGGGEQLVLRNGPATLTIPFDADAASLLVRATWPSPRRPHRATPLASSARVSPSEWTWSSPISPRWPRRRRCDPDRLGVARHHDHPHQGRRP